MEGGAPAAPVPQRYPMRYDVEYPLRLSRVSTFFRGVLILPLLMLAYLVSAITNAAFLLGWIAVFLRRSYPDWVFDSLQGAFHWNARLFAYAALQSDSYPSFSSIPRPVALRWERPEPGTLSRWRVLVWKSILLLPHVFLLAFLFFGVFVVVVLAWFAILVSGRYPRGLFAFVTGVSRWYWRVQGYFASFTDSFPPFALSAEAAPPRTRTTVVSGVMGFVGGALLLFGMAAAIAEGGRPESETVSYEALLRGQASTATFYYGSPSNPSWAIRLVRAHDPGDDFIPILDLPSRERVVVFEWRMQNVRRQFTLRDSAQLKYRDGQAERSVTAHMVVAGSDLAPMRITSRGIFTVRAVFVVPRDAIPLAVTIRPGVGGLGGFRTEFE